MLHKEKKRSTIFFRVWEGIELHVNLFLKSTKSSMFGRELTSYNHSTLIPFFSLEAGSFLIFFFISRFSFSICLFTFSENLCTKGVAEK